jgi:DNA-binding NarL/FixJ family response regulator
LVLVCAGFANKAIAERMGTTEQVVKNHMREILPKAAKATRCELIVFVFRHGVVTCPCTQRSQLT